MSDETKPKETQSELFEQFSSAAPRTERFPSVSGKQNPILFSTNTEQLLMAGILSILALCAVFFLGVIRGKALSGAGTETAPSSVERPPVPAAARPLQTAKPSPPASSQTVQSAPSVPAVSSKAAVKPAQQPLPDTSAKPYTIQIVTYRQKELAEAEMSSLRAQGLYSFIIPSGEYYQVCAGQYASRDDAKADLARLKAKTKDCFLRRR